ncbi:TetR/AcrR family transcriptional regulator [Variovorax sp. J22P240]|uniref:TetR/AcrR family transcriptional regulator n=1 Tax=unclassified Variovorax TaxID=663243 RepID=UPI002577D629|nr:MULTISPECIES: TetR/AcrR family transcriptional regulator [unclassified Variovorax]MDL9997912.1 TetR/AcrR family transcriptional regulator [Variovorax sp. J22P240]MDM0049433.1 TetR/AcrR family transcriptional regulator [Variovorax sp. J22R115]
MSKTPRLPDAKFTERRAELGEAAMQTLAELGYARTSLREIAQNSAFSHGVLHYYFTDKLDLILCSVRQYKARCVTRYDEVTAEAASFDELMEGFTAGLAATVRQDASMHRLWYDLRAQSLFEPAFRADVAEIDKSLERMIWRVLSRFAELSGTPVRVPSNVAYAMFDGLFQQCLMKHLAGDRRAVAALKSQVRLVVGQLVGTVTGIPVRQPRHSPVIPRAARRGAAASPAASASR